MTSTFTDDRRLRQPFSKKPIVRAVQSKMVHDTQMARHGRRNGTGDVVPNYSTLHSISTRTSDAIQDAENMRAVMPDIELAESIVVSSILSPNDFRDATITWKAEDLDTLPPGLINQMVDYVDNFTTDTLPLKEMMPSGIAQALFVKGSTPYLIIPESTVDDIINGRDAVSMESMAQRGILSADKKSIAPLGILGHGIDKSSEAQVTIRDTAASLEHFFTDRSSAAASINPEIMRNVTITDNLDVLKFPMVVERHRRESTAGKLYRGQGRTSTEALSLAKRTGLGVQAKIEINQIMNNLYNKKIRQQKEIVRVTPMSKATRAPIGHPLTMTLPPESLIPVHTPGNPKDHIGYLLLLDAMGYPLSNAISSKYYQDMVQRNNYNRDQVSQILGRANLTLNGSTCNDQMVLQELQAVTQNYVELDILERFRNGILGDDVEIERPETAYTIMLARSFANMRTQILWVPAELVTYLAFDYNEMGIGRSILEKNRVIGMMRSALTFANSMAAMKNSANHRTLTFRIDPDDLTPEETFEKMYMEYTRVNSASVPFASAHPLDVIDQISMANTSIVIEGAEDLLPDIGVSMQDASGTRTMVDTEHLERVDKQWYMGVGVTQAMMDSTADIQFAVAAVNDNILFAKRTAMRQEVAEFHYTDFVVTYMSNSGKILSDLITMIRQYKESSKDGVEYERAAGSRLKGQKPELEINVKVKEKLFPDLSAPEMSLDPTEADKGSVIPATEPEEAEVEAEDDKVDPYSVVSQNEEFGELPADEMDIIEMFFSKLRMYLPKPDNTKLEEQMAMLEKEEQAVDKFLEIYMTDDLLTPVLGADADADKAGIRAYYKSMHLRKFIAENNILPNLQKLLDPTPDEAENVVHAIEEQGKYLAGMSETIKNIHKAIKARYDSGDGSTMASTGDDLGGDTGGTDDGGGEFGNELDDLNLDDGSGGGTDNPPEVEAEDGGNPDAEKTDPEKTDTGEPKTEEPPPEEPELE